MRTRVAQHGDKEVAGGTHVGPQPSPIARMPRLHGMPAPLLSLQRTYGNRYVGALLSSAVLQRKCACSGTCAHCEEEKMLQRKSEGAFGAPGTTTVPPIVYEVLRSPGQPLDPATRAFMEPRFGHDFSRVRVHTDARAATSARALGAEAYT